MGNLSVLPASLIEINYIILLHLFLGASLSHSCLPGEGQGWIKKWKGLAVCGSKPSKWQWLVSLVKGKGAFSIKHSFSAARVNLNAKSGDLLY